MALMTTAGRAHAARIPPVLQLTPPPMQTHSTNAFQEYHEHVANVLPVDITILICLLVALLVIGYRLNVKYRRPAEVRTKLALEIGTATETYSWIVGELPYSPSQYHFTVSQEGLVIRHVGFCWTGLLTWSGAMTVSDTALGRRVVTLKHDVWIYPRISAAVTRLVSTDEYYALLIVMALIVLRPIPPPRTMSLEDLRNLYPTLPSAPRSN